MDQRAANSPAFAQGRLDEADQVLQALKALVRGSPRMYDLARSLDPRRDATRSFFDHFSRERNGKVHFIQIGASDGMLNDPIREFVIRDRWRGLLVEPLPTSFSKLQRNYQRAGSNLKFLNAAIATVSGTRTTLWTASDEALRRLPWFLRISARQKTSFDREHLLRHLQRLNALRGLNSEALTKPMEVPAVTLNELMTTHWIGADLTLLVMDIEGLEADVILGHAWEADEPEAIFFESHNLRTRLKEVTDHLGRAGYRVKMMGGDAVAMRERLPSPRTSVGASVDL